METLSTIMTETTHGLPDGWAMLQLEDVVDILDSRRVPINAKERETRVGKVPYYGATGQVGWIDDHLFDEELVLLGEDGAPFLDSSKQKAYVIRGKSWVNNHAHVLRARNGIPNPYIKYYLDTVDYHDYVTGTTRLKLNQAMMRKIPVPVAPPDEQKRIVAEIEKQFSRLDEAVASLKRVKANLKRYKAAVLKAAVEGKLTEEWRKTHPDIETADKLLTRILVERQGKWEEAELAKMKAKGTDRKDNEWKKRYPLPVISNIEGLPKIPQSWKWASFEQISTRVTVGHVGPMKDEYVKTGIPFLRSQNVRLNRYDHEGLMFISREFHKKLEKSALQPGDLVVVRSGSVGVCCVIPKTLPEANCADLLIVKRPQAILPEYGAYYMNAITNTRVAAKRVGVALTHFNTKSLAAMPIPVPPLDEQRIIVDEVGKRLSISDEFEREIVNNLKRAERLRESILGKAFVGDLV